MVVKKHKKFELVKVLLNRYTGLIFKGIIMTVGIYKLSFRGTDKVYIGQSKNLEARYKQHIYSFHMKVSPKKLQEAYNTYGEPDFEILSECNSWELDEQENETIEIWNSANTGFNTMASSGYSSTLFGESCGNSKYLNEQVIEVFKLLVEHPNLTQIDIHEITGVSKAVINGISCGDTHLWLAKFYPEMYKIFLELREVRRKNRRTAKSRGIVYSNIKDPLGAIYTVESLRGFCREHGLNHGPLGEVLRGRLKHHKGWTKA